MATTALPGDDRIIYDSTAPCHCGDRWALHDEPSSLWMQVRKVGVILGCRRHGVDQRPIYRVKARTRRG